MFAVRMRENVTGVRQVGAALRSSGRDIGWVSSRKATTLVGGNGGDDIHSAGNNDLWASVLGTRGVHSGEVSEEVQS